ncbi:MAG TPA: cysteine desulfurase family protein [Haloplasmataceae bacterium]
MKTIYLDYASTTNIREEVFEAMLPYLKSEYGNPSSLYDLGISNKKVLNNCRKQIASIINAKKEEIYFCSGGSEANNWAIKGVAFASNVKKEIITSKIEHHSVLNACHFLEKMGYKVHYLDVDNEGFINIDSLKKAINENTLLVSVMMANNEIGTIQNIKEIGAICRSNKVLFHTDAIQAISNIPIDVNELNIDLMSVSAHKFYGPKGIGFLYIREKSEIENLIHGGNQEKNKRAGTENVAYIVGMTMALELSVKDRDNDIKKEREFSQILLSKLQRIIPNMRLNGPEIGERRLPGNLNLSFKGLDGSLLSYELSKAGICVSTGSACNSSSIEPSHVLQAIKVPKEYINGTIRITLGKYTTLEDINTVVNIIKEKI